jgi:hypothetical protein
MALTSKDGIFRLAHEDVLTVLNRVLIANAWDLPTTGPSNLLFNRTTETIYSDDPDLTYRQAKNNIQERFNDNIFALKQSDPPRRRLRRSGRTRPVGMSRLRAAYSP